MSVIHGTHSSSIAGSPLSESSPNEQAQANAPTTHPHISGLNYIPEQNFGPLNLHPDSLGRPDPNNGNLNEAVDTTKNLPQLNSPKNLSAMLKKAFTSQNGGAPQALQGALPVAALGSDVGGAVGHVASLSDLGSGVGIFGGVSKAATSGYQASKTLPQALDINQVLNQIPQGRPYDSVRQVAEYASNQTQKRLQHQANNVVGGTLSAAGSAITLGSAFHLAPVGVPLTVAGAVVSGTHNKVAHNLQKGNTVIESGAGTYNALGADRNVHAINLLHLLGTEPAGENTPVSQYHAEQVVKALGLDPNDLRSNPNAQELIFGKLSSR